MVKSKHDQDFLNQIASVYFKYIEFNMKPETKKQRQELDEWEESLKPTTISHPSIVV